MKKWAAPVVEEMNINETAHNWTGLHKDGGYIGDGDISGHLSWTKPECGNGNEGGDVVTNPEEAHS